MMYLRKVIRDALKDAIRYQNDSAKFYKTAREALHMHMSGYNGDWYESACQWQSVAASMSDHARNRFEKFQRATYEYETAFASVVMVDGEWHQRIEGGTRCLYTNHKDTAIMRAWADIFKNTD